MKVGLTFDLRSEYLSAGYTQEQTAEFDSEETVAAIEFALQRLGHETQRIGNARRLTEALVAGVRWDLVFNICEGVDGIAREAQVPAILELYRQPYTFSDAATTAICMHKGWTKALVRAAGLNTPEWAVCESEDQLVFIDVGCPLFVKPLAEGTGKGVGPLSRVESREGLLNACRRLWADYRQPVLIEEYLPGREFTVGLLGTGAAAQVIGSLEIHLLPNAEQGAYSYLNKERCEEFVRYECLSESADPIVAAAENLALRAWRVLGCRDAGRVDVRCDRNGVPAFVEVNPLAGLHPTHSDLPMICAGIGMSYGALIEGVVRSACARQEPLRALRCA